MSENLEELLNVVDEENEGDYDLGDDEEEALLDENYDVASQTQLPAPNSVQNTTELEQDVLDLDDETELNDEDSENLNSTVEEEERCRQDKFSCERVVPQKEQQIIRIRKFKTIQGKQNFRGGFARGRRGGIRGNFHNNQNRSGQFQSRNKVLINPHFKGNVHIKHNVSLAWDKNNGNGQHRKPVIQIPPWSKQTIQDTVYHQNPVQHDMYVNQQYQEPLQNARVPVHQRLGICSNIYSQPLPDNQLPFVPNFQQPVYQQLITPNHPIPPNPMCNQTQYPNQYSNPNQFVQPLFNNNSSNHINMDKPIHPQFHNHWNVNQNQPIHPANFPLNQNYSDFPLQVPQNQFVQTYNNNTVPNIGNYLQNVPVVNNETMNVNVPYYEEPKMQFQRIRRYSGGSPIKRKFDFKGDIKKKKRTVLSSNLHEVKMVDVGVFETCRRTFHLAIDSSVHDVRRNKFHNKNALATYKKVTKNSMKGHSGQFFQEDEDEEMKAYRKKIEHQKMVREKLLRQKEERRKQAAKKLQAEEQYQSLLTPTDVLKEEIPVIMNSNKPTESPAPAQIVNPIKKTPIVRVDKTIVPIKTLDNQLTVKRVVSTKPIPCENVSAGNSESETLNKDQLTSFLSNRKIFAKDKSLVDTSLVVVSNLATGTSEVKLRKLCQGVGDIQVRVVENNCTT